MKLAIMQPYFFPYIGYYQAILAVDKYILYDNLNYIKEGWVNRNKILIYNGSPAYIILSLKSKSSFLKINQIELVEGIYMRKKIINSVYFNYKQSKFFNDVFPLIENILMYETNSLSAINKKSIIDVCEYLDVKTNIVTDSFKYLELEKKLDEYENNLSERFPDIHLNKQERKVYRVIAICKMEKANHFVNAINGRELYRKEEFKRNGISINFINTLEYIYKQNSPTFFPHLSIIDVLMNCGKEGTKKLLNNYNLI